jgi:hypothetical protein
MRKTKKKTRDNESISYKGPKQENSFILKNRHLNNGEMVRNTKVGNW